jgi:iron(III) transport system permease protein
MAEITASSEATRNGRAAFARPSGLDALTLALAAAVAVPILSVVMSVFAGFGPTFTHIAGTVLLEYAGNTIILTMLVVIGVLLIGVPAAWLVAACEFPGRKLLEAALILPLAAPAYVLAYAYADFLSAFGPLQTALRDFTGWEAGDYWFPDVRSLPGAAAMLILVLYPYVYLLARARFLSESATAREAARLMGRGSWAVFFEISLPLARPALVAGTALAAMETIADYGTVSYYGVPAFTTGIYNAWFSFSDPIAASQLAAILIGFVGLALVFEHSLRGGARYHETGRRDVRPARYRLSGKQSAATRKSLWPPIFGFLIPALVLIALLVESGGPARDFGRHLVNSLTLAGAAAILVTAGALVLAFAKKERPKALAGRAASFAAMGYAVPGAVIAVGVLSAFVFLDGILTRLAGASAGLVLTGGIAALLFAYLVLYLAVALQSIEAGLERVTPSIAAAARLLSQGSFDRLRRVHLPLIAPSVLTGALLVFVDTMKELPATLMLRPFNFDTLAIAANNYASDERLYWAAAPSLAIVAAGIIPCILLIRGIAASQLGSPTSAISD